MADGPIRWLDVSGRRSVQADLTHISALIDMELQVEKGLCQLLQDSHVAC